MPGGIATNHNTIPRPNREEWFNDTFFAEGAKSYGIACASPLNRFCISNPPRRSRARLPERSWFAPTMNAT